MKGEKASKFRLHKAVTAVSAFALAAIVTVCAKGAVRYPGDVNTDKTIDISDAVLLARYLVEDAGALLSRAGVDNADANGDGKTDTDDVILIVKQVAKYAPMPPNPYEEGYTEPVTTTTVTSAETTVTETQPNETEPKPLEPETDGIQLTADTVPYPLDVSISVLTGQTQPNEMLTVSYDVGNIIFAIFANDPLETTIAVAYQDIIVGYYKFCNEYTVPDGYEVREFRDQRTAASDGGDGQLYAVLVMREDVSIDFQHLSDSNDMSVLAKLNYYGSNGVRALNGLQPLKWNEEVAKLAHKHSTDMGEKNYFDHISHDESGLLIFYEVDDFKFPLNRVLAKEEKVDDNNTPAEADDDDSIYYLVDESGNAILDANGQKTVMLRINRSVDPNTHAKTETTVKTDGYSSCGVGVRMDLNGIEWRANAENIDYGYTDPFSALNGWVNSSGHRKNLLSDRYTDMGVGFAFNADSDYLFYGTQDFCSFFD